jgi:SAM-dependent methyltransferase
MLGSMDARRPDPDSGSVIRDIAPADAMYKHHPEEYFQAGPAALRCIDAALEALQKPLEIRSILDLPSGHGRVLRFLRHRYPEAEITACDTSRDGVDFCARTFGAIPVYSHEDPAQVELGRQFDLIWCGSLLTHLDAGGWRGFLDLFESSLASGGLVVFTTHGRRIAHLVRNGHQTFRGLGPERNRLLVEEFDRTGFGYQGRSGRDDFGISLSAPSWVCAELERRPGWRLVSCIEMGWAGHDTYACVRRPVDRTPRAST